MDAQRIEDVTEWESRRFSNGFADLRRLADRGFSGAVTDGTGWLLLLNGRVVGVVDAELDSFADASGTAYQAPEESLPLLFAMLEAGGTKRAQYYTNDTSLAEADRKLSAGGFTGYIELSENVLSGDYYVTYTGGESHPVAFVGNARRLETGEEAFGLADDEVGIYTVYEVDLDVREIPEAGGRDDGAAAAGEPAETAEEPGESTTEADTGVAAEQGEDGVEPVKTAEGAGSTEAVESTEADGSTEAVESTEADGSTEAEGSTAPVEGTEPAASTEGSERSEGINAVGAAEGGPDHVTGDRPSSAEHAPSTAEPSVEDPSNESASGGRSMVDGASTDADVFSKEEQWRETTAIPALDPKETSPRPESAADPHGRKRQGRAGRGRGRARDPAPGERAGKTSGTRSPEPRADNGGGRAAVSRRSNEGSSATGRPESGSTNGQPTGEGATDRGSRVAELESALEELEAERDSLTAERDEIAADRDEQKAERERLEAEVESLKAERDRLREELDAVREELPDGEQTVSAAQARNETNLFIRYGSKGGATLEDAHDGDVDRDALRENLKIEHHTGFESKDAVVDGVPYREFLEGTMEYGFTRWLVEDLPFEIRDTGNESDLRDLYDALPEIDRAEIDGSVSIVSRDGGEETREQRTFDLVLRDRMGNPLFIAELNDSRAPTGGATLESLVANGGSVAGSNDAFAAAFAVTASYFEPEALETASNAVGGGLFGTKRRSFVKLSRKRGYHLCLAESRDGGFHLTVPDL